MGFRGTVLSLLVVLSLVFAGEAAADVVEQQEVIVGEEVTPPPPPAQVEEVINFNQLGPYIGVGLSYFVNEFGKPLSRADLSDSWGFNIRAGYRFMDYLAVEGLYEYGNNFGCRLSDDDNMTVTTNVFTANAKAILPIERFQPYLTGGVGFINATQSRTGVFEVFDASGTNFAGRVGGGFDVYLTEYISLLAEAGYLLPTGGQSEMNMIPINVGVRFIF